MFGYYLQMALRSLKRNKALTALMVLAIALGIGASMTTLTVFHVLSGDPIPQKSDRLFYVQLDPEPLQGYVPGSEPIDQLSRFDAETLLAQHRGERQAMMTGGAVAVQPDRRGLAPFQVDARYTSADFFPMFDLPFAHGGGWNATDDAAHARVVVIGDALNHKVFGGGNSVGKTLRLSGQDFRVIGVLGPWRPSPRFYDLQGDRYGTPEEVFVPFTTAMDIPLERQGSMNCWGDSLGDGTALNAQCAWTQYWVELNSPAEAAAFKRYLDAYSAAQHAAGRFQRPVNTRLRDVMTWLDVQKVVPSDVRMQLWLALGFLLVCVLNTVGLLLAKFLRRSGEIGVRRALGASRRDIFMQLLVEAGLVGVSGGVLGLGLASLGLWAVRQQPIGYADLVHLDPAMLATTFVIAIGASLLAGLLPAWRAAQVTPALQLKSA
jgi:putative ABC transport system permease protein